MMGRQIARTNDDVGSDPMTDTLVAYECDGPGVEPEEESAIHIARRPRTMESGPSIVPC